MILAALLACDGEGSLGQGAGGESSRDDSHGADTIPLEPGVCPPATDYEGEAPHPARTLAGDATWTLDFDAEAEARGLADCTYRRAYAEMVEVEGHGWVCPECDWFSLGDASIVDGYEDCYLLIASSDAVRQEHLGLGVVDGEPHFWRSGSVNVALGDMGPALGGGTTEEPYRVGWSDEAELTDGGTFLLTATGSFTLGSRDDVTIGDVDVPIPGESACGWPDCNPGGPNASFVLATGSTFPNARLVDQCEEPVDVWDFWGRYLVIDSSAPNCGPCIAMAQAEAAWVQGMATAGIEVEWITLLNAELAAINQPASAEQVQDWIELTGTTGAVLRDEGFAYATMPDYVGYESGMSYPTVVVVDPDMTLLGWDSGYDTETPFGAIEAMIRADFASR